MKQPAAFATVVAVVVVVASCGGKPVRQDWENDFETDGEDLFLVDEDLVCLADSRWEKVDNFRLWNPLGHQLQAAEHARGHALGEYPVGTVVQLFHDEASVKRGKGFSPETGDWEFLALAVGDDNETIIVNRSTTALSNIGGSCISCHDGAASFDFVCGTNGSCGALPPFVNTNPDPKVEDPRCAGE